MLKTILAVSGKPGLYKLISQAKNMLIVESVADKKRMPVYASDKVISLGDIAMYTDANEVPLATDRDRVRTSDIKKLIQWYNLLVAGGETEFVDAPQMETVETVAEEQE